MDWAATTSNVVLCLLLITVAVTFTEHRTRRQTGGWIRRDALKRLLVDDRTHSMLQFDLRTFLVMVVALGGAFAVVKWLVLDEGMPFGLVAFVLCFSCGVAVFVVWNLDRYLRDGNADRRPTVTRSFNSIPNRFSFHVDASRLEPDSNGGPIRSGAGDCIGRDPSGEAIDDSDANGSARHID